MKIYKRIYDNPLNEDGSQKLNELLGDFEIIEVLFQGDYESNMLGTSKGKVYLITETEVSGLHNPSIGGSQFEVKELVSVRAIESKEICNIPTGIGLPRLHWLLLAPNK